jgi:hypothetical protein
MVEGAAAPRNRHRRVKAAPFFCSAVRLRLPGNQTSRGTLAGQGQVENQRRKSSAMNTSVLRKTALARERAVTSPPGVMRQWRPARLRRRGPVPWMMLALLVLAADFLLAVFAWLAVDLVMG